MKFHIWEIIWTIMAILFLSYGIVIKGINSGTFFYMIWILMGVICIIMGLCAHFHLWKAIPMALRVLILSVSGIGVCLFLFVEALIWTGFSAKGDENLDYIIVLGAQVRKDGPSYVLKRRLDAAEQYLRENPDTICIVSGGQGANEPFSEAKGMADYLISRGIDADRILLEDKSLNTIQNILYSKELIANPDAQIGIVTNAFHVFRGVSIAKKQGLENAHGIAASSHPLYLPNNLFREFFGVVKDFLLGNM